MNMKDRIDRAYKGAAAKPEEKGKAPPAKPAAPAPREPALPPKRGTTTPQTGPVEAAAKAEGFLKTGGDTGLSKAARFLLLLGTDEAAKVLSHLSPAEVESVAREILTIKKIDTIEAEEILSEFGWLVKTKGYSVEGGPETAERMLTAAFGDEKARAMMRKAAPESLRPFRFLESFEAPGLHALLKEESPQILAVLLPWLEPKKASGLIQLFPEELRIEVVKRIARLEKVDPEVLRRVEEVLKERIRKLGTVSTEAVDGKAALAGILRHVDPRLEGRVLAALDEDNPETGKKVREKLFTLDDVVRVPNRELQKALRDFQDRDLALTLKGRADSFREKILSNVSKNRATLILDEYRLLGAVRREDADEAAREFLAYLKQAWDEGELVLEGEDELVE